MSQSEIKSLIQSVTHSVSQSASESAIERVSELVVRFCSLIFTRLCLTTFFPVAVLSSVAQAFRAHKSYCELKRSWVGKQITDEGVFERDPLFGCVNYDVLHGLLFTNIGVPCWIPLDDLVEF